MKEVFSEHLQNRKLFWTINTGSCTGTCNKVQILHCQSFVIISLVQVQNHVFTFKRNNMYYHNIHILLPNIPIWRSNFQIGQLHILSYTCISINMAHNNFILQHLPSDNVSIHNTHIYRDFQLMIA